MLISPLTIAGTPTSGKAILQALLDGHKNISSLPIWHDNLSAAFCRQRLSSDIDVKLLHYIYGNNLRLMRVRQILATQTEWHRLEAICKQRFYVYMISADNLLRIPINFDFYKIDKEFAERIWKIEDELTPVKVFDAIAKSINREIDCGQEIIYFTSLPWNEFTDYVEILQAYPCGRLIYVYREPFSAIASTIYRSSLLKGTSFVDEVNNQFCSNNNFWNSVISRNKAAISLQKKYPNQVIIIDFNELILQTYETIKKLCEFLNIKYTDKLLKTTFMGVEISDKSTGKIQDDMHTVLNKFEKKYLFKYMEIIEYISSNKLYKNSLYLPAQIFFTHCERTNTGEIYLSSKHNNSSQSGHLFYGPYITLHPGKYIISFNFYIDSIFKIIFCPLIYECNCGSIKIFNKKRYFITKNMNFTIYIDKDSNSCIEFRVYSKSPPPAKLYSKAYI